MAVLASLSCRQETASPEAVDVLQIKGERITSDVVRSPVAADPGPATPSSPPVQPASIAAQETEKSDESTPPTGGADEPSDGEPLHLGFEKLSGFTYEMPSDLLETNQVAASAAPDKIPAAVRAFDQKAVALKGFMLPLKVEAGLVTELLILRDQSMCCYGAVPKINEWVSVKMTGKGVKPVMDQPVTLVGKLHVGEVRENGYLVGIYTMDGERIANPPGL